jgi:hypothetical protein
MIIFSQAPAKHSRLANSIEWMSKIQSFLNLTSHTCCFPWAIEKFDDYLDSNSFWMSDNGAYEKFLSHTKLELTAKNVSQFSRKIESEYEILNGLKPFDWRELIVVNKECDLLYITGKVDFNSDILFKKIDDNSLVIINEPFYFNYGIVDIGKDEIKNLIPNLQLYETQKLFVNSKSLGRKKVGLHIRRGDYQSWRGGAYFYDDNFWFDKVNELNKSGCITWIFTNELNPSFHNSLTELGALCFNENFEVDFTRMMFMDEIYGPPSTFSVMASKIANLNYLQEVKFHYLPSVI